MQTIRVDIKKSLLDSQAHFLQKNLLKPPLGAVLD
jgi:hypothetical protein